VAQNVILPPKI